MRTRSLTPTASDIKLIRTIFYQYVVLLQKEGIKANFTREEYVNLWLTDDHWKQRGRQLGDKVVAVKAEAFTKTELDIDDIHIIVRGERMYKKTLIRTTKDADNNDVFVSPANKTQLTHPNLVRYNADGFKITESRSTKSLNYKSTKPKGRPMKIDSDEEQAIRALRSNTELQKRINELELCPRSNYVLLNLRTKKVVRTAGMLK